MTFPGRLVLLGHPVAHSVSPALHNAALERAGLAVRYHALDVPPGALDAVLHGLIAEHAAGNVTIPHKEAICARCDVLTPLARRVGAVNTFWSDGTRLSGDNTDVGGFAAAMLDLHGGEPRDSVMTLLGAGGAASAVCEAAMAWENVHVRIYARTEARALRLVARFGPRVTASENLPAAMADAAFVVNATPLGLRDDDPLPVALELLAPHATVLDLVYRHGETRWVRLAREAGHTAADGFPMLVEQAALAFERWFGIAPDRAAMRAAIR